MGVNFELWARIIGHSFGYEAEHVLQKIPLLETDGGHEETINLQAKLDKRQEIQIDLILQKRNECHMLFLSTQCTEDKK